MFLRETWQKEGDIRQIEGLFWDRNLTQRRVFLTEKGLFSERNLTERRHFLTERRTFLSKAWWKDGDYWQKEGCSEGNLTERRRYLTERRSFLREKHDRKKAISDRKKGRFWENPDTKKGISDRKKVFSGKETWQKEGDFWQQEGHFWVKPDTKEEISDRKNVLLEGRNLTERRGLLTEECLWGKPDEKEFSDRKVFSGRESWQK